MKYIVVYQSDLAGFFVYENKAYELALQAGSFNVPYGALEVAPAKALEGYVARISAGGSDWEIVEDHRRDVLYYVKTPASSEALPVLEMYQIGAHVNVDDVTVSYDGGGQIPDWLTPSPLEFVVEEGTQLIE